MTASSNISHDATSRRAVLAGLLATGLMSQSGAASAYGNWDGVSSAIGSCPLEDGADCRMRILQGDKQGLGSYEAQADNKTKVSGTVQGVPVADMNDKYVVETYALIDKILNYTSLDVYDPDRVKLVQSLKKEGPEWVSKYARGGSARKQSARKFYIVVDSLSGHFASNGYAPLPYAKKNQLFANIDLTKEYLQEGK